MRAPLIGVLGGMGPLATVDFLHKLVTLTPAMRDQDHVATVIWNVPQIPDRQKFLAGTGPSPLPAMIDGIRRLNAAGVTRIAIPCNTAHIWFDDLQAESEAAILHIADATLNALPADTATVGLIATRGTLEAGLYQSRFHARGISVFIHTDAEIEELFVPGCYAVKSNELDRAGGLLESSAQRLIDRGAGRLVLACTEVPVALEHIRSDLLPSCIDPAIALARACLEYWQMADFA
ncbi:MAG: amino acid racemase [Asticcacaulis sp.]